jgi:hypothetical protein
MAFETVTGHWSLSYRLPLEPYCNLFPLSATHRRALSLFSVCYARLNFSAPGRYSGNVIKSKAVYLGNATEQITGSTTRDRWNALPLNKLGGSER